MVEPKQQAKETVSSTSWVACKDRLEVNQKDSQLRTFCNVQICCRRLCWRMWSVLLICYCVSFFLHSPLVFVSRRKMVATHTFHKLVFSARSYMQMASWGFCFSAFDSSGEPSIHPEETVYDVPCSSGTEFAVEGTTSNEEVFSASTGAPMEIPWNL